ncbi:MAG: alanine--tRNA ligase, partial [Firmicutes bacterium]|nr:alanine--tRNA ligase [Bacillota bacterium]
ADSCQETVRLHTAAHLLLAALREKFGDSVVQKGSNITPERLRFDFSFSRKVEPNEISEIEKRINGEIAKNHDVIVAEMSVAEAQKTGAVGTFCDRYGDRVKVFTIGDFSKEICGGPHVANTKELGVFKIQKEENVGSGIRRVKAVLVAK